MPGQMYKHHLRSEKKGAHKLISQRVDKLGFAPGKISLPFKHLDSLLDLALLQAELREGSHGGFALGVNPQGFVAAPFSGTDVLLPLVHSETLIDQGQNVGRGPAEWRGQCYEIK